MRMRRLYQIVVIIVVALLIFFPVYIWVPGVRAAVDSGLGPQVTGFFSAIGASITGSPIWIHYITPWPNQIFIGLFLGLIFAWFIHKGFNQVRNVFVRSAEAESGQTVTMREPIQSVQTSAPTPIAPKEEKKESEDKT